MSPNSQWSLSRWCVGGWSIAVDRRSYTSFVHGHFNFNNKFIACGWLVARNRTSYTDYTKTDGGGRQRFFADADQSTNAYLHIQTQPSHKHTNTNKRILIVFYCTIRGFFFVLYKRVLILFANFTFYFFFIFYIYK